MRDVQNETDNRNMAIDRVGIRDISWPISVPDRTNGTQETVAQVSLSVSLPQDYRGDTAALAKELRKALGCGSAMEEGKIVLQGDLMERVEAFFNKKGVAKVTKSG